MFLGIFYREFIFNEIIFFYPRSVLAFGYCSCLRLCVGVSVCMCASTLNLPVPQLFTHLRSPNLDQMCKTTWLRSLLFRGRLIWILGGSKITQKSVRVCPRRNWSIQLSISKFGPKMHLYTIKAPINFRTKIFNSMFDFKTYFRTNLGQTFFCCYFVVYILLRPSLSSHSPDILVVWGALKVESFDWSHQIINRST